MPRDFIGSSDIATILNLNQFKTPLQLWAEMTGEVEAPDLSEKEAVEWGKRLERVVSKKFAENNNVKLMAYKNRFYHKDYKFFSCELDNIIVGTDTIVEIKTTNAWAYKDWKTEDEMPEQYICQVMWAMGISGRKTAYIAVLIGGQRYLEKKVEFDQEFFDDMIKRALEFWQCVQDKIPPMAVGLDNPFIISLNPTHNENIREAEEDVNATIALLLETKNNIKTLIEQKDDCEAKLKQIIGSSLGIKTSQYILTWKQQPTTKVDTEALKKDGLYDKYKKVSETRVLRVKKGKVV